MILHPCLFKLIDNVDVCFPNFHIDVVLKVYASFQSVLVDIDIFDLCQKCFCQEEMLVFLYPRKFKICHMLLSFLYPRRF